MRHEPWFFETVPPTEARVSCWQGTTNDHNTYDIRVHAECAVRMIEAAAFAGIQLLVFLELYLHGPPIFRALDTNGDHDDEALEMIASAAGREGVAVAMGYAKRSNSGIHSSAIVWHADGTVAFYCDKVRLATDDERNRFLPGDEGGWRAFDLKLKHRNVRCGVCICFDSDYMTSDAPRRIAEDGAKILLVPMAASFTGISESIRYDGVAEENNLFVLRANMAYDYRFEQSDGQHCGASSISVKNGRVIQMAGANEETFVTHQLKLAPTEAFVGRHVR